MTRSQKVVLIGLALIVVLFALVTWHGAAQPDCIGPHADAAPGCRPGGGIKSLGRLTSPFAKGMKLPQPSYAVAANTPSYVTIPAAAEKMRSLKIRLSEGSAAQLSLANAAPDEDSDPEGMAKQRVESRNRLPYYDDEHVLQRVMTLVVTDKGGLLTMHCTGPTRCVFEGQ